MQSNDSIRRNMAVFSMSVVSKLTELSPRQIRYYETHELITPERTEGNKRLFSMNDLDRLLEIKSLIEKGFNIKGIKQIILMIKITYRQTNKRLEKNDCRCNTETA